MSIEEWPNQNDVEAFYGNPWRGFESKHLTTIDLPFAMHMGHITILRMRIHTKCAASLTRVVNQVWDLYDRDVAAMERDYALEYGGSYNFRPMRGGRHLSMHAYGCAVDIAPSHNPFHSHQHHFTPKSPWVAAFEREGWAWGGRWHNPDAMHFQAALL
jgi:D-alanyl-D-alanine carboxypeptidase